MLAADLAPQPSKLVEKMTKTPVGLCPGAIKKGNKWTFKFKYYGKKDSPKDVLAKGLYDTKEAAESEIDLFRFAVHNYTLRKIYSVWQSYSDRSKGIPLTSAFIQLKDEFMAGKAKFLKLKTPNNVNASEKSIMEHAATICSLDPSDLEQHFTVREVLVHVDCTCKSSHCRNCGSNETMTSCTIADVLKSKGESRPLGRRRCNDDHWKTYAAMDIDEKARLAYKHAFNDLSKGKSAVVESEVVEYLDKLTIDQIDYQSVKLMKSGESDDVSTRISTQFSDAVRKVRARVYYRNDLLKKKEAEYQDALATTKRCETGDALILDNLSDVTDLVLEEVIGDRLTVAETLSDQERVCLYAVIRLMDGVVARQQEQKKSRHSKRSVREAVMSAKDLQKFLTGMALKLGEITHANDTIRRQCLQQVQSDFSPRNCLEFLDEDAKMSLNLWSKMRKLDNFSDDLLEISSRQDSMFASAYSITEEKKVFRKVIEDQLGFEFDASNPNVAFMTAEKIITLIVRATADYTNHTCEIRMSGDGKVQGGLNFTFWGFKLNDSQSADDYLICGVMCGSDNAENHDDFVQPYFKKVETICKKGTFTVDGNIS